MFNNLVPNIAEMLADLRDDLIPPHHQAAAEDISVIDLDNPTEYVNWDWNDFYTNMSLIGLHNTEAFQDEFPVGTPQYQNFLTYSNTGMNSFANNCEE